MRDPRARGYSAALCRGLIEARRSAGRCRAAPARILRLYAAASLKPCEVVQGFAALGMYSAALCRGLIEATQETDEVEDHGLVFCGFMPRPH